jgi:hypothetical protein
VKTQPAVRRVAPREHTAVAAQRQSVAPPRVHRHHPLRGQRSSHALQAAPSQCCQCQVVNDELGGRPLTTRQRTPNPGRHLRGDGGERLWAETQLATFGGAPCPHGTGVVHRERTHTCVAAVRLPSKPFTVEP